MATINWRSLKRQYELEPRRCVQQLTESLKDKLIKPTDFSLRELAESVIEDGAEYVRSLKPGGRQKPLLEAGGVQLADFSNITGQVIFTEIMEKYNAEEFVFTKLIPQVQSSFPDMERIAGISNIGDNAEIVDEGQPYPKVGVSEDYIDIGPKVKRGFIVPVTKEAVYFDRTGVLLQRCGDTAFQYGYNREKRHIDCVIDENTGATSAVSGGHRYHWKGTSYATYQASTPWVNVKASNGLVDWTNMEAAFVTFCNLVDPFTGEPLMVEPKHLVVSPTKLYTARRVVNATTVKVTTPGYATTSNPTQTEAANPVDPVQIIWSRLLNARMATNTTWYLGDLTKAFRCYYNWAVETQQAAPNSSDEFELDIVSKFKVSNREIVSTVQPRAMLKNTVA